MSATGCEVLVVEDDVDIRDSLRDVLELEGYAVCTASNGQEALDALNSRARPCLILLDLMMPVMDGAEFLSKKNVAHEIAAIPVVVVSAWAAEAARLDGAQGVVSKPVDLDSLLAYVERYC